MSNLDKHLSSLFNKGKKDDGTITLNLHANDIQTILECLVFANQAAKIITETELKKGTLTNARKFSNMQKDSSQLVEILLKHLDIGQPMDDELN